MAEIKKYLDTAALGTLVDQIKAEDAKGLKSAKDYADSLASNYDAAGAAAGVQTKLDEEIARAKAAEKANADAIAAIKDGEVVDSFKDVETELAKYQLSGDYATKAEAQGYANAKDEAIAAAKKAGEDAQSDLDGFKVTVGETYETKGDAAAKLTEAKGYTDDEIAKVDAKVAENAGDIEELAGKVATLEANGYDDTEVRGLIKANADALDLVEADVEAIKGDYLKSSDKEEVLTAVNTEKERAMGVEGGLEERIETMEAFWEAAQADGTDSNVIDTLKEIQEYIAGDESGASAMAASIKQNADDIDALEGRMDTAEAALETVDSRIAQAITDANLGQYAKDADLTAAVERVAALETADGVQDGLLAGLRTDVDAKAAQADLEVVAGKVTTVEGKVEALEGKVDVEKVSTAIATAKQEAIDVAALDAANKDAVVLAESQKYINAEIDKVEESLATLQGVVDNKAAQSEVNTISGKVGTLETDMAQAKTDIDAVEAKAAANEGAISTLNTTVAGKAEQDDLDAAVGRIAKNEADIVALTSSLNSFTPITSEEIVAMFA